MSHEATSHALRYPGLGNLFIQAAPALCKGDEGQTLDTSTIVDMLVMGHNCRHVHIQTGFLQSRLHLLNGSRLERVSFSGPSAFETLDLADNPNLQTIDGYPTTESADVSNTGLPWTESWCSTFASDQLYANDWHPIALNQSQLLDLLTACFRKVGMITLSTTTVQLNNLTLFNLAFRQLISSLTYSNGELVPYVPDQQVQLPAIRRSSLPLILLPSAPVRCGLKNVLLSYTLSSFLETTSGIARFANFSCACDSSHHFEADLCVPNPIPTRPFWSYRGAVAAVFVFPAVALLAVLGFCFFRRVRGFRVSYALQERLLESAEDDVAALKQGWQIESTEITLTRRIGAGTFGEVYAARWEELDVCVKVLKSAFILDEQTMEEFDREVDFMQRCRHPNIVRY
jgi:hypothetical protein